MPTSPEDGFQLHVEELERRVTPRTRCLVPADTLSVGRAKLGVLEESNVGVIMAVKGAAILKSLNLGPVQLIVGLIVLTIVS